MKTIFKDPPQFNRVNPVQIADIVGTERWLYQFNNGYAVELWWRDSNLSTYIDIRSLYPSSLTKDDSKGVYASVKYLDPYLKQYADFTIGMFKRGMRIYSKKDLLYFLKDVSSWGTYQHVSDKTLKQIRRDVRKYPTEGALFKYPIVIDIETYPLFPTNLPLKESLEEFTKRTTGLKGLDQDGMYGELATYKDFISYDIGGQQ